MDKMERDETGSIIMNESNILRICEQDGLYEVPDLNSKLFLHFKAFRQIDGLDRFINVRVLWLENNFITRIQGIGKLVNLTHLLLQNNMIEYIDGLDNNIQLHTLNLSFNRITKIYNITQLQKLSTLELTNNKFKSIDDISELQFNTSICTLNLQSNYLVYTAQENQGELDPLLKILLKITNLKCLYLMNNEYIRSISNYRKQYISQLKNLTYLDTQPIFPRDRRIINAWGIGGAEREKQEREAIFNEEALVKLANREEVRKTLPQHLANKIRLFEKTVQQFQDEIVELEELKAKQLTQGYGQAQIDYVNEMIYKKQNDTIEFNLMLANMRQRQQGTSNVKVDSSNQEQAQPQCDLDNID